MDIFKEIEPLKTFLRTLRSDSKSIGFVPTMGALHNGHMALIAASKRENSKTICSIFVNPTQFNNSEDLAKYPRTLESDIEILSKAGCNILFCPAPEEMYSTVSQLKFDFGSLDKVMEGSFRPGHFSGVALVVSKLFNIVNPDRAYFGQKDFQQYKIIEKLVEELKFNVTLRSVPIEREPDGLAMSSRNSRLTSDQRKAAIVFYESLLQAKNLLKEGCDMKSIIETISKRISQREEIKLEYLELADATNLMPLKNVSHKAMLLIAGYVGEVRLIDNLLLAE